MIYCEHNNPKTQKFVFSQVSADALKYGFPEKKEFSWTWNLNNFHGHGNSQTSKNKGEKNFRQLLCLFKTNILILLKNGFKIIVPVEMHLRNESGLTVSRCREIKVLQNIRGYISTGTFLDSVASHKSQFWR